MNSHGIEVMVYEMDHSFLLTIYKVPEDGYMIHKAGCTRNSSDGLSSKDYIIHISAELYNMSHARTTKMNTSYLRLLTGKERLDCLGMYIDLLGKNYFSNIPETRDFLTTQILLGT